MLILIERIKNFILIWKESDSKCKTLPYVLKNVLEYQNGSKSIRDSNLSYSIILFNKNFQYI